MEQRLASGSAARAFINDESVKARKQKERSEVARKRMAARKAGEKAAAEGVAAKRPRGRPKKEKVALRKKQQEASPWRKGTEEQHRLYYIAMQKAAAALTEAAVEERTMAQLSMTHTNQTENRWPCQHRLGTSRHQAAHCRLGP